jgi:hypothetical protein
MLTRRQFLDVAVKTSAGFAAGQTASHCLAQAAPTLNLELAKTAPVTIPANFIGLGYEMSSVASRGLLSAENEKYVRLVQGLASEGVLRVGGIVANYTRFEPQGLAIAEPTNTVITLATLEQFAKFLEKTNWTTIWSLNFSQGGLPAAIEEARAVSRILGKKLLALEIGNEVDSYGRGQRQMRELPYEYENYRGEYRTWHKAIADAVPGVSFAAPDTASNVEWVERMALDANGEVQLLTTHYYRNGQKRGSAEQLMLPDPRLPDVLKRLRAASQESRIPWRMCETNSFSGGGRPGVSDTFLGALWTLDFMLLLATNGCAGVNMETGVNQLGFVSSYSPIQDDGHGINSAGVPYYGMLAFSKAFSSCREALPLQFDPKGANLTAYAMGASGKVQSVVIVNREPSQDFHLKIDALGLRSASVQRLSAPSADATTGITFAGATVDASGFWKSVTGETIHNGEVHVPHMSAAVLRRV